MMAEDETKKDETPENDAPKDEAPQEETPQDEAPQEETPQDEAPQNAGPAAEEGTSSDESPEEPSSTPPASEESGSDEAPAEEEDDRPWKEKRRLERSRRPHKAKPQQTAEERKAARVAERKRRGAERRKERAAAKAKKTPGTGTPAVEKESNAAKVRQGIVVSDKGQKSITVRVDIVRRHPTYEKVIRRSRTLHAHDERNEAGEGDVVRVVETRPLSKTKRWRLVEVLEKAK
jgi:small subunit ribosomal protein S17